ncbi:MAG: ribonuclease H-like domain-containing protein [Bacillota bacterium]
MKIIKNTIEIQMDFTPTIPIDDICFFDIETTGLSRDYHHIYLIGILYFDDMKKSWTILQLFADSLEEEEQILHEFTRQTRGFNILVSYNGDSFDIPFIIRRLEKYGHSWSPSSSLDLYKYIRENRYLIEIPDLKLKTVEKYIGINRIDSLSGKDCIELYKSYAKMNSDNLLQLILQHNYDDLQHMPLLLRIMNLVESEKTIAIESTKPEVFFHIDNIDFIKDHLVVDGTYRPSFLIPWNYFQPYYSLKLDDQNKFHITMEIKRARLSDDILADIADTRKLSKNGFPVDYSPYEIPDGILVLRADNKIFTNNIKTIIRNIFLKHYNG